MGRALVWRALDDKGLKNESLGLLPKVNREKLKVKPFFFFFLQGDGERAGVPSLIP